MKRISYILAALSVLFAGTSCGEKFFEQYPSNSVTEGNFYKTDDDFNQAVYACYAKLKTAMSFHLTELAYRSDECQLLSMAVSTQDRYDLDHFAENSSNGILENIWNAWYNGIYRCNDVLDHLEGRADIPNADKYRAEALFIRSWYYFNLYRCFGAVPVATTVLTPEKAKTVKRCTDDEMYTRLTLDLSQSASYLPVQRTAESARVTKIAAQTLLAKVYLTFGKYTEAKSILELAMNDSGYTALPATADVFDVSKKMNKEILFALYYDKTNDNGHGYWYSSNTSVAKDRINPTPAFKALYESKDNRFDLIDGYVKITSSIYAMKKWNDTYDATYTQQVGNDFPHLRYVDIYLMYAEASGRLGDYENAAIYLNKTRTRAGLDELSKSDIDTEETFLKALADERGREFALEGHRWFDLVRLGLAVDYFKELGYSIEPYHLLFPIPQSQIEIVNNPDILWQNPGYES